MKYGDTKLEQGKSYSFNVIGMKDIPGMQEQYILQLDYENGPKFMLDSFEYRHYNLEVGRTILCRIDKVNCSGKVFIEPRHPVYTEGRIYDFKVNGKFCSKDEFGQATYIFQVEDKLGAFHEVACTESQYEGLQPEILKCRVDRVRKGDLWLSQMGTNVFSFQQGNDYDFKVLCHSDIDDIPGYLLEGPHQTRHWLEARPYRSYEIEEGQELKCIVQRLRPDGSPVLEPEHPVYKRGVEYKWEFVGFEWSDDDMTSSDGENQVAILQDEHGLRARLIMFDSGIALLRPGDPVMATVQRYRRGEVILTR